MDEFMELDDSRQVIKQKLRQYFDGKIVRKDLTKHIKEGANVPVYVLEFLLGQYCSSDDDDIIEEGVSNVKRILADNFVRPDEAQKVLSTLRERGSYTVIDKITVHLNIKEDRYEAEFSNLGVKNIPIHPDYPSKYDRLLCGGIWCILQLDYEFIEEDKKNTTPIRVRKLTPIQMPHIDMDELKNGRKAFTKEEWIDVLIRSTGMEPDKLSDRVKWLLLARMIPLVEITSIFVNWDLEALVSPIFTKRFPRIASWFPVDRRPLQTCSIIWQVRPSDWLVCGTVWLLMKLRASHSRIKMVFRL